MAEDPEIPATKGLSVSAVTKFFVLSNQLILCESLALVCG
jgi:hypothetical protein